MEKVRMQVQKSRQEKVAAGTLKEMEREWGVRVTFANFLV